RCAYRLPWMHSCWDLMRRSLLVGVGGPQADADDHELGRLDGCYAHEADEAPLVDIRLGHGRAVAFDEEGFFRLRSFQGAVAPDQGQEVGDRVAYPGPQRIGVGLEHDPLQTLIDTRLDEDQQSAHVDVFPVRVAGDAAAAIDANAA